jgi:flavin reductase (DIM6/NTAB) family NADH-FMN oxidoreductase RutF
MSSEAPRERFQAVTSEEFRRACGRFATGVAIASATGPNGVPHGLTVNSFSSVSLNPPLVLICLGHAVAAIDAFRETRWFGLSILRQDQRDLSERFARRVDDRFEGLEWRRGATGVPLLADALATMECEIRHRVTAGDHDVFIGEMVRVNAQDGAPLIYFAGEYRRLA